MFLVPNIDQMYKEMKKIVEVGNKHGVGRSETHIFFFWPYAIITVYDYIWNSDV
jgi:hypothetical protein